MNIFGRVWGKVKDIEIGHLGVKIILTGSF